MKLKFTLFIFLFLFTLCSTKATVSLIGSKTIGGSGADYGKYTAFDKYGNIYTIGDFEGTVDFDPGSGVFNLTSAGSKDIYILKLDANGNFIWAKQMGGASSDLGNALALDTDGNIYYTGRYIGTADFDPGIGISNMTSIPSLSSNLYIAKLDSSGNFLWAKSVGGSGGIAANSIVLDPSANVYVAGNYNGTNDFDPGAGTYNMTSTGQSDCFILKLDNSGNFGWSKGFGGSGVEQGLSIAYDLNGNLYIAGTFEGTVDFDPGVNVTNLTSNGFEDVFVTKYDLSGNLLWAKSMGGAAYSDGVNSIISDASGNVYFTGNYMGTVDFDPGVNSFQMASVSGSYDIFVCKLDASGNFGWAKTMGGTGEDVGKCLALDNSGNVYITGHFIGTADFDPGEGELFLSTVNGNTDIFIVKLDANGNYVWAKRMGGTSGDNGNYILVDASENVFVTAYFTGTSLSDPTGLYSYTSAGLQDVLFLKFCQGASDTPVITSDATVCSGANSGQLTLTGVSGSIVRWESSTDNFTTVTTIANTSVNQSYNNLNLTTKYRALIGTSCGNVYSSEATITVNPSPAGGIVSSDTTVCYGNNSGILSLSGNTGSILRWESSKDNFSSSTTITNTTATQSYTNLTATTKYRAVVKSGSCTSVSTPATITINPAFSVSISMNGNLSASSTICKGSTTTLTATGANSYSWSPSTGLSSTTGASVAASPTTTTTYTVTGTVAGCTNTASKVVYVDAVPQGGTVSSDATGCYGSNSGTLTLTGYTGSIVRWERSTNNFSTSTTLYNNSDWQTYTNLTATTQYRAVVQSASCTSLSSSATITVNSPFSVSISMSGNLSASSTICKGSTTTLTATGADSYSWTPSTGLSSTSGSSVTASPTTTTTYTVTGTVSGCSNTASKIVYVDPGSAGGAVSADANVCSGANSGTLMLSGYSGSILRWESSQDNFSTFTSINNASAFLSYTNLTNTTKYRAVISSSCGTSNSSAATITVSSTTLGGIAHADTTVCYGNNSGVLSLNGFSGDILRWESSKDNFATVSTIQNTTSIQTYSNLTATTKYRAVTKSGACLSANSTPATVTVKSPFTVTIATVEPGSASNTICKGSSTSLKATGATTYSWSPSTGLDKTTGDLVLASPLTSATYTVTGTYLGCTASATQTIFVEPIPVGGSITSNATVCSGNNTGMLTLTGYSVTANIVRWESSPDNFATITPINNTNNTISYKNLTATTKYRAVVQAGTCQAYSNTAIVTVNPTATSDTSTIVCGSFNWYGTDYTYSGNYTKVFKNQLGCDSTVTLHLTVIPPTTEMNASACNSFNWYGTDYFTSGNYSRTFKNRLGCDSTVILHLWIVPTKGDTSAFACGSFNWYGTAYTNSGNYVRLVKKREEGCDSTVTLHLTIKKQVSNDTTAIACSSFNWYGTTYTSSGTYTKVFNTPSGCDSTVTLHLTVNTPSVSDTTAIACSSFNWYGTTYTSSGDYQRILQNQSGCDSTIILHLTITTLPTSAIRGAILLKDSLVNYGIVSLFKAGGQSTQVPLAMVSVPEGKYEFNNLESGEYHILYSCGPDCGVVPTYFKGKFQYQLSDPVHVYGCYDTVVADLEIQKVRKLPPGKNTIKGSVKKGLANKKTESLGGIGFMLVTSPAGEIVAYTETDINGDFIFEGIPNGDYQIIPDIPGYKSESTEVYSINAETSEIVFSSVCMNTLSLVIGECEVITTIKEDSKKESLKVTLYPNPGSGIFNLVGPQIPLEYKIYNSYGQEVLSEKLKTSNAIIDISGSPDGIYLMYIVSEKNIQTVKLVKQY